MPRLELNPPALQDVWDLIAQIALDYKQIVKVDAAARNGYRLENVLWTGQRDELLTLAASFKTDADTLIDAIRGLEPRPTAADPVPGDLPEYPTGLEGTFAEANVGVTSYYSDGSHAYRLELPTKNDALVEDIAAVRGTPVGSGNAPDLPIPDTYPQMPARDPALSAIAPPLLALPYWWFTAAELYRMVLRADTFLSTPVEPLNGELISMWLASMYYAYIQLEVLQTGATAAVTYSAGVRADLDRILNIKARRHKRFA